MLGPEWTHCQIKLVGVIMVLNVPATLRYANLKLNITLEKKEKVTDMPEICVKLKHNIFIHVFARNKMDQNSALLELLNFIPHIST